MKLNDETKEQAERRRTRRCIEALRAHVTQVIGSGPISPARLAGLRCTLIDCEMLLALVAYETEGAYGESKD